MMMVFMVWVGDNDMIIDEEQYEYLHNFVNKPNKIKFVD